MSGPIDRRTFLKRAAQVGVGALVVGTGAGIASEVLLDRSRRPWDASSFPPPGRPAAPAGPEVPFLCRLAHQVVHIRAVVQIWA